MKNFIINLTLIFCSITLVAQVQYGGLPLSKQATYLKNKVVPIIEMPTFDVQKMLEEDKEINVKGNPFRFGKEFEVDFGIENSGTWETLPNGDKLWRLTVYSPNAFSLNFQFSNFYLPQNSNLYIYNQNYEEILGAFTAQNNKSYGKFSTTVIKGNKITFEYYEPKNCKEKVAIQFSQVVHAYRNFYDNNTKGYGDSGACNINVACNDDFVWNNAERAVALILDGGFRQCSGAMLNNVSQDGTPFFLTADHCKPFNLGNIQQWMFMFNYQSPNCANQDGPTNQTVSGATLRAKNTQSDFMLLELSSPIPSEYNVFFNGWSNENLQPQRAVGIHHPSGDVKKISFENDPLQESDANSIGINSFWEVTDWDEGTTEPGSSGSPIFNESGLIVGQLYGGNAACGNDEYDVYGKFSHSWGNYEAYETSLAPWLNPNNEDVDVIQGNYQINLQAKLDASINLVEKFPSNFCETNINLPNILLKNLGSDALSNIVIKYQLNEQTPVEFTWTGNLQSIENTTLDLPTIEANVGNNLFKIELISVNGNNTNIDDNTSNNTILIPFEVIEGGQTFEVLINTDEWEEETSFELTNSNNDVVLTSNIFQENALNTFGICLTEGCYTFTIYDSYGDGICCGFGEGSYSISLSQDGLLQEGGEFEFSESTTFCFNTNEQLPNINSLSVSEEKICIGSEVTLDFVGNNYVNASWTFIPNSISPISSENPTLQINEVGIYTAILNLTNNIGEIQQQINFEVFDYPTYEIIKTESSLADNLGSIEVVSDIENISVIWEDGFEGKLRENLLEGLYNFTIIGEGNCEIAIEEEVLLTFDSPIYPNPVTNGMLNVYNPSETNAQLSVFDISGKKIANLALQNGRNTLDISGFNVGIYILHYNYGNEEIVKKFVVR